VQLDVPDYSGMPIQEFYWTRQVYVEIKEILTDAIPPALGMDATLTHCLITGRLLPKSSVCVTKLPFVCSQISQIW